MMTMAPTVLYHHVCDLEPQSDGVEAPSSEHDFQISASGSKRQLKPFVCAELLALVFGKLKNSRKALSGWLRLVLGCGRKMRRNIFGPWRVTGCQHQQFESLDAPTRPNAEQGESHTLVESWQVKCHAIGH